jgi:hypothetical protein
LTVDLALADLESLTGLDVQVLEPDPAPMAAQTSHAHQPSCTLPLLPSGFLRLSAWDRQTSTGTFVSNVTLSFIGTS